MSIADAVRARELEARVVGLEAELALVQRTVAMLEDRVRELEKGGGEATDSQAMRLVQGQLNSMRARLDKADAAR